MESSLRYWMRLVEGKEPGWFLAGQAINVAEVSPDADFILDGDEWDFEWRLCEIPASLLAAKINPDWDSFLAHACPNESREDEAERCRQIEQWMREAGGAQKALNQSPVLAVLNGDGTIDLLDGSHRAAIAVHKFGATHLTAAVGKDTSRPA